MQSRFSLLFMVLLIFLVIFTPASIMAAEANPRPGLAPAPVHPQILEAAQARQAASILGQVALSYATQMSAAERDRDCLQKIALAKRLLDVRRLVELRRETQALLPPGMEVNWEYLRTRRYPNGDRVGVTLSVPVWVPARAQKLQTYCAFEKKWQIVALTTPRKSGCVWFDPSLADINNKAAYRAETIQFEINSKFAPLVGLLLEYAFREGYYDPAKRLPLMSVRGGEDTYAGERPQRPDCGRVPQFPGQGGRLPGGHRGPVPL